MAQLFHLPKQLSFSNSGTLRASERLYFYLTGTTTSTPVYQDSSLSTPHTQPISADANGKWPVIWLDSTITYKCSRYDYSTGSEVLVDTIDPINPYLLTQAEIGGILYPRTAAEIAAGVTPTNYAIPSHDAIGDVLIERYFTAGLDPSAQANASTVTTAINNAKLVAVQAGAEVRPRGKTYYYLPATSSTQAGPSNITIAWQIVSNMHFNAQRGCVFKLKDSVSTGASPVRLAAFHSNAATSNWSIKNIDFDGNGANNRIVTGAPYNTDYNQAAISISGDSAYANDIEIDHCKFRGTAGVCQVVLGQSNTPGVTIGSRAKVTNCDFIDNGTDSSDFTAVYGWMDDVTCQGCNFIETNMYSGTTGGVSAYEVHGARHKFIGNDVKNYYLGIRVAPNYTSDTTGTEIIGNTFRTLFYGVEFYRSSASDGQVYDTVCIGNRFFFDSSTASGAPSEKAAFSMATQYAIKGVTISGNILRSTDTVVNTVFFSHSASSVASQKNDQITLTDNKVYGATAGLNVRANATNGIGYFEVNGLNMLNLTNAASTAPTGAYFDGSSTGIDTLVLNGINCVDDRGGSAQCDYNIRLTGIITTLSLGTNTAKGMVTSDYDESSATITNRVGYDTLTTITYGASMTPNLSLGRNQVITATNTTAFTINAPTNPIPGATLRLTIRNTSGGALGAITWNAVYKMSAWTSPADTYSRSITFRYNGTNWVQIEPAGVDVPN